MITSLIGVIKIPLFFKRHRDRWILSFLELDRQIWRVFIRINVNIERMKKNNTDPMLGKIFSKLARSLQWNGVSFVFSVMQSFKFLLPLVLDSELISFSSYLFSFFTRWNSRFLHYRLIFKGISFHETTRGLRVTTRTRGTVRGQSRSAQSPSGSGMFWSLPIPWPRDTTRLARTIV